MNKAVIKEEFDTSWFDLKNYECLKSMSIVDWQKLLGERFEFCRHVNSCRYGLYEFMYEEGCYFESEFLDSLVPPDELFMKISGLLKQGVITNFGLGSFPSPRLPDNTMMASAHPVSNLTVLDVVEMLKEYRLHYNVATPNIEERQEMLSEPFDNGDNGSAKIKIDLHATDEKLKKDFERWLENMRKTTGYYCNIPKKKSKKKLSNKELYTQKDFDSWIKNGVIPYIDLILVADIEYKEITQYKLGELIFPNDPNNNLDTCERIRQVTKPLAEELIKNKMHKTLLAQLTY